MEEKKATPAPQKMPSVETTHEEAITTPLRVTETN